MIYQYAHFLQPYCRTTILLLKTASIILFLAIISSCTTTNIASKERNSTDRKKLLLLANLYTQNNNLREAGNLLDSVQQSYRNSEWHNSSALLQVALSNFDVAEQDYKTAIKLNDNNFNADLNYSSLLIKMLFYEKAVKRLQLLIKNALVSVDVLSYAYFNLGFIYYKKQQSYQAIKYFAMSARTCMKCVRVSEAIKIYEYYLNLLDKYQQEPIYLDKSNVMVLSCRAGDDHWLQRYDWYIGNNFAESIKC